MNPVRSLIVTAAGCAACSLASEVPVEVKVVEAPELQVGVPAQLRLDVRTGVPTAGVEIAMEGDAGLTVHDFAPRVLPATTPVAGSQLFVDLVATSVGTHQLAARLVLHVGGERVTRLVTLPLAVSGPTAALPAANELAEPITAGRSQ